MIKIASGVYVMKYFITDLSMKSLKKKYKKIDLKEQNKEKNPKTTTKK